MGDVRGETRLFSPLGKSSDALRFIDFSNMFAPRWKIRVEILKDRTGIKGNRGLYKL